MYESAFHCYNKIYGLFSTRITVRCDATWLKILKEKKKTRQVWFTSSQKSQHFWEHLGAKNKQINKHPIGKTVIFVFIFYIPMCLMGLWKLKYVPKLSNVNILEGLHTGKPLSSHPCPSQKLHFHRILWWLMFH